MLICDTSVTKSMMGKSMKFAIALTIVHNSDTIFFVTKTNTKCIPCKRLIIIIDNNQFINIIPFQIDEIGILSSLNGIALNHLRWIKRCTTLAINITIETLLPIHKIQEYVINKILTIQCVYL